MDSSTFFREEAEKFLDFLSGLREHCPECKKKIDPFLAERAIAAVSVFQEKRKELQTQMKKWQT